MFDCLMFLTDSCSTLHLYLNRITKSSSVVELRDSKNLIADCNQDRASDAVRTGSSSPSSESSDSVSSVSDSVEGCHNHFVIHVFKVLTIFVTFDKLTNCQLHISSSISSLYFLLPNHIT